MIQAADMTDGADQAARLRDELTDELLVTGKIVSPVVEKAFRTVPREMFVPADTPLEAVYSVAHPVVTKTNEHGVNVSSISATYIQARMIEMADIRSGMTVLEIGSGGYNAALLAEVVGPEGHMVSIDIDAEITGRAGGLLDRAGYGGQVTVLQADAEHPVPGFGPFDRPAMEGAGVEFGATAHGPHGQSVATAFVEQTQAWDHNGRDQEPTFRFWPTGSTIPQLPACSAVLKKHHGAVSISWPQEMR